jgi:hypothetical protein
MMTRFAKPFGYMLAAAGVILFGHVLFFRTYDHLVPPLYSASLILFVAGIGVCSR